MLSLQCDTDASESRNVSLNLRLCSLCAENMQLGQCSTLNHCKAVRISMWLVRTQERGPKHITCCRLEIPPLRRQPLCQEHHSLRSAGLGATAYISIGPYLPRQMLSFGLCERKRASKVSSVPASSVQIFPVDPEAAVPCAAVAVSASSPVVSQSLPQTPQRSMALILCHCCYLTHK